MLAETLRRIWKTLLLVLVAVAIALTFSRVVKPKTPAYQGRTVKQWLEVLEDWHGDTNNSAFVAFREMDTNAIPTLLQIIESGGPPVQRMIAKLNREQSVVELPLGRPWNKTLSASYALYAMGAKAKPALPVLTNMLFHTNALITSTIALAGMGSEAIPALLSALTNQDNRIRSSTASGLARIFHSGVDS